MGEGSQDRWVYPIVTATSIKEARRTHTPYGIPWEMVGMDGGVKGSPRPFYGFKRLLDLTGVAEANRNEFQQLLDSFPLVFRVGDSSRAWGFVYAVWDSGTFTLKVFLEYKLGDDLTQLGPVELRSLTVANADDLQFSVVVQGIKVYVFIEGQEPFLFYYDEDLPGIVVKTDTGPGGIPKLDVSPGVIVTNTEPVADLALVDEEGVGSRAVDVLAQFGAPTDGEPAKGRVHFVGFSRFIGVSNSSPTYGSILFGPSELNLWNGTPEGMDDPVFSDTQGGSGQHWVSGLGPMGGASLRTGRPTSFYKFAYQLADSVTGRKSNLSELASGAIGSYYPTYNSSGEYILFGLLELVWDSSKYDQCYIYRTVRGEGETNAVLNLDAIVDLDDYLAANQSGLSGSWKRAYYVYQLVDAVLVAQPVLTGLIVYDSEMPTAGAALLYDGSMLFGNTQARDNEGGGLGVIRWSSPYEISPELVSPLSRYYLSGPDEEVIAFARVGPNVIAHSLDGMYHIRKETTFIKATPVQDSFGAVNYRALEVVGSTEYVVTESGVKAVYPMAEIEDVAVVDKIIQEDWAGQLHQVEMAYDPPAEALYIFNVQEEHAVVLWLKTGQMTELYDMNFVHCRRGKVPLDPDTSNRRLKNRACFFSKVSPDGTTANPKWRVWVPDYRREASQRRMLGHTCGYSVFQSVLPFSSSSGSLVAVANTFDGDYLEGCKLYVLQVNGDPDSPLHFKSMTIRRKISPTQVEIVEDEDSEALDGLPAGSLLGISPVFVRVQLWAVGLAPGSEPGPAKGPFDYTRLVHVMGIGATFSGVSGNAAMFTGHGRFAGMVYKGDKEQWENFGTWAFPTSPNGGVRTSILEGPSPVMAIMGQDLRGVQGAALFPAIEICTPDLDYTLLNVLVYGTVRQADVESLL